MAIFKVPRITTAQRSTLVLDVSEIVCDTDENKYYGGDGVTLGGIPLGGTGQGPVEQFTLTATNITNKNVQLTISPEVPSAVLLFPEGGIVQRYGVDYTISGDILSWDGLGLDNFLEEGEFLIVKY